ncbi:MAG TPA: DNA-processing protein DprA [Mycobacteriales bacterium]|nr:DNA-processing protein DprA [Mycobacteriales bacterium]
MSVADEERVARAELLRISEPAMAALVRHVRSEGCVQAVADIRRGTPIHGLDVDAMQLRVLDAVGERDLAAAAEIGARLVCPGDEEWPAGLDDLDRLDAGSFGLWVRGRRSLGAVCERAVAVVGTRAATDYGASVAAELAAGLAERGWTVVSGLAFGIDAAAHRGALAAGGASVAVLACGVDVAYPKAHESLYAQLVADGLGVSEHPPGAAPYRARFLIRNRLIAALSAGTVVVEAAPRSGARSTARHAGELFRHVMAVPGPVTSTLSAGCHQLLRDRPDTVLVTKADEVIEQVGGMGEFAERVSGPVRRRDLLGPAVSRVMDAVPVRQRVAVRRIATTAGMRVDAVAAALAALETHGLVDQDETGWRMTALGRSERRTERSAGAAELPLGWW